MTPGLWQILIIAVVFIVIFGGRGKISAILSDLGKGIKSFKKGMSDDASSNNQDENNKSENSDTENK